MKSQSDFLWRGHAYSGVSRESSIANATGAQESRRDLRQNARLALHSRALLVERVLRGQPNARGAGEFGVNVKITSRRVGHFRAEGPWGLRYRSRRPRRSPMAAVRALKLAVLARYRQRLKLVSIATQLDLLHLDVNKLGRITRIGHRIAGTGATRSRRPARSTSRRHR